MLDATLTPRESVSCDEGPNEEADQYVVEERPSAEGGGLSVRESIQNQRRNNFRPDRKRAVSIKEKKGYVYFIETHDSFYVKIGFSASLARRLAMFTTVMPGLRFIGCIPGTFADEQRFHSLFPSLRDVGEWFRNSPDLINFIGTLALIKDVPTSTENDVVNLHMFISRDIMDQVEDFRFENRLSSKLEAMEIIIAEGLRSLRAKRKKKQKPAE